MQFFSRYENLRCSIAQTIVIQSPPVNFFELLDVINLKNAIRYRDELLGAHLNHLGVSHLIDIGCDFGSLLASCNNYGIDSFGYDISLEAVEACRVSHLNAEAISFQTIVDNPEKYLSLAIKKSANVKLVRAISILNTIGGKWDDEALREKVLANAIFYSDYLIITSQKKLLKKICNQYSLEVVTHLGPQKKSISFSYATYLQYGHPLFARNFALEIRFWQKLTLGRRFFQDRVSVYSRHTVILRKKGLG